MGTLSTPNGSIGSVETVKELAKRPRGRALPRSAFAGQRR